MKTLLLLLSTVCMTAALQAQSTRTVKEDGEQLVSPGKKIVINDEEGDAEFSGKALPAFDLKSVTFEDAGDNQLKVTFEGSGPIDDLGRIYSWFAVHIDLDFDLKTGQRYGDFGGDLILGAVSTRDGGNNWGGEANSKSDVGNELPIAFVKAWTEDNKVMAVFQSELFEKYPTFRAVAFAHHAGDFVDTLAGGGMDRIELFEVTKKAAPPADVFAFQKVVDAPNGKREKHNIILPLNARRVQVDLTATEAWPGDKWASFFMLSLIDKVEDFDSRISLLFINRIETKRFEVSTVTNGFKDDSERSVEKYVKKGETVTAAFEWKDREITAFINGEEVTSYELPFTPKFVRIFASGAEVLAEKLEIE